MRAAIWGGGNISGSFAATAGFRFVANENQSSGHLGTDIYINATPAGSTSDSAQWQWCGNGDVVLNGSGSAVSTTATGGFTFLPSCAGAPTGTPARTPTGSMPFLVDSSDNALFSYVGSNWLDATGGVVKAETSAYTMLPTDKILNYSIVTARTVTLPSASACVGHEISIFVTSATAANLTLAPASGDTIFYQNVSATVKVGTGSSPTFTYYVKLTALASGKWYVSGGQ